MITLIFNSMTSRILTQNSTECLYRHLLINNSQQDININIDNKINLRLEFAFYHLDTSLLA